MASSSCVQQSTPYFFSLSLGLRARPWRLGGGVRSSGGDINSAVPHLQSQAPTLFSRRQVLSTLQGYMLSVPATPAKSVRRPHRTRRGNTHILDLGLPDYYPPPTISTRQSAVATPRKRPNMNKLKVFSMFHDTRIRTNSALDHLPRPPQTCVITRCTTQRSSNQAHAQHSNVVSCACLLLFCIFFGTRPPTASASPSMGIVGVFCFRRLPNDQRSSAAHLAAGNVSRHNASCILQGCAVQKGPQAFVLGGVQGFLLLPPSWRQAPRWTNPCESGSLGGREEGRRGEGGLACVGTVVCP